VVIKDSATGASAVQNFPINIPTTAGGSTAFVGFGGGTGGLIATQDILTWTYPPTAPLAPTAPWGVGGTPGTASSITLTWTNNATNQAGYHLDRATDVNFTQNLITQNLPARPTAFTDSATGLAPGGTFYYRLRAFNTAGDSANSNTAAVAIPLAPGFIGSAEYIQKHGGMGAGWVQGMYQDLLGRTPAPAEVDGWVKAMANGMLATQVAYGFAASAEPEGQRVTAEYSHYLHRSPTSAEVDGWVKAFQNGDPNEDVVAGFVGSSEYFQNHTS
jgi:hypothetical protein